MIESRMNIDKIKFGKFIAGRRKVLSVPLTQKSLAEILHVGTSAIGKIEAGETLPSFELFVDLADALLMTPGELMMVMAERDSGKNNYMEMSDWLINRLENLVNEYHELTEPPATATTKPAKPLLPFAPNQQAKDIVAEMNEKVRKANPKPAPLAAEDIEKQESN
jgi:transcriptional regulator with XRE-family HTH domain